MHVVVALDTPQLGNRSYLVHDGEHGLVVDPPRDIERMEALAEREAVTIAAVAETHVHNDFVSGGRRLARRHRAEHLLSAPEQVGFPHAGVRDGDKLQVGTFTVEVLATPGHTSGHVAFLAGSDQGTPALLSGGSLLFGTVGRTDLSGASLTDGLARDQVRSARRLAALLPPDTTLHPTHGFGSFCASTSAVAGAGSTIGLEAARNPVLDGRAEDTVVRELLAGFGPVPSYYAHMADLNRTQDLPAATAPARLGRTEVLAALRRGIPVVDVRRREAFAGGHHEGVTSIEYGDQCATYVGWLLPWGSPLVLVGDDERALEEAAVDLGRIGVDRLVGVSTAATPEVATGPCGYRRLRWEALAAELREDRQPLVLDVRTRAEFDEGHLRGALSAPVHELPELLDRLPAGEAWVHCKSGYRAGIAASLLHAAGRAVVHVDDSLDRARAAGLPLAHPLES